MASSPSTSTPRSTDSDGASTPTSQTPATQDSQDISEFNSNPREASQPAIQPLSPRQQVDAASQTVVPSEGNTEGPGPTYSEDREKQISYWLQQFPTADRFMVDIVLGCHDKFVKDYGEDYSAEEVLAKITKEWEAKVQDAQQESGRAAGAEDQDSSQQSGQDERES